MSALVVNLLAVVLARLSLPMNHRLGATVGWLAWSCRTSLRTVTEINLDLCFPEWTEQEKQRVGKASLIETGKALTESFWLWKRPSHHVAKLITITEGEQLLRVAQDANAGLLVATPHIGSWEVCCLPLVQDEPITCLYQAPRQAALEPITISGRVNLGCEPTRLDPPGIKHVLQKLKAGNTVGLLPDQEPDEQNGEFAPKFGVPANTMTLLAKFAHRTKANVIFCFAERLPRGRGWQIHYHQPESDIGSSDKRKATTALNAAVELCIRNCPEQYLWNYKRFRRLPDGTRRNYKSRP